MRGALEINEIFHRKKSIQETNIATVVSTAHIVRVSNESKGKHMHMHARMHERTHEHVLLCVRNCVPFFQ